MLISIQIHELSTNKHSPHGQQYHVYKRVGVRYEQKKIAKYMPKRQGTEKGKSKHPEFHDNPLSFHHHIFPIDLPLHA